jgi:hypothetical protein
MTRVADRRDGELKILSYSRSPLSGAKLATPDSFPLRITRERDHEAVPALSAPPHYVAPLR